ncbi:CaiB/BaiF CoA-transferase family protein [Sphingorhabdus sp. Alg239-R122]|uniref:CaiB/BaiF CoA transferase family protein n=1 Tax=Sphingorhabdus sp. Alg239-R122 TaxID=2305989 RepID=UPI0013D9CAEC|nr:CaiB/BaiF CoA-transferase family protein [Sphingorhabdus sp. Alg239-R122]
MPGALDGLTIVEMAGIGPAPFAAMMLADHGAHVIRVEKPDMRGLPKDILNRSRERVELDLKSNADISKLQGLIKGADGLIEGFRPGVMERLGLGPDELLQDNPALVYGRMTGWGQTGPYAPYAGHDINYIALSGALHSYGRANEKPTPPVNAVGDFGGGGMMMAFGMLAGILSAQKTGQGQVIDCAMTDGSAVLSAMTYSFMASGMWHDERGLNLLDTGAHFYDTYETADGKYVSVGAIEPQFYTELRKCAGLEDDPDFDMQMDPQSWKPLKQKLAVMFHTKTRDEWCALMEHKDTCFAPVLSLTEAPEHPHNKVRETYLTVDGVLQPAPAPRFSGTPAPKPRMD